MIQLLDRIKRLCEEKNSNITALCIKITGSSGNLSTWKKGNIRNDYLIKIAQYFNVSADYLLGLTDDTAPSKRTSDTLSGSEQEMLSAYRQLDDSDQGEVRGYINGMLTKEKYKIHNEEAIG